MEKRDGNRGRSFGSKRSGLRSTGKISRRSKTDKGEFKEQTDYPSDDRPERNTSGRQKGSGDKKSTRFERKDTPRKPGSKRYRPERDDQEGTKDKRRLVRRPVLKGGPKPKTRPATKRNPQQEESTATRLNKFIASSGVCSRREADHLIEQGLITINGKVVTQLGTKVEPGDEVRYAGERLYFERYVYVLMNKPKDFITTVDDPQGRRTVMDLVSRHISERIYPVGRLDKNTTGLLLLTNDGDLAKKLTHPKHGVKKVYHVVTDVPVSKSDLQALTEGVELEDGFAVADSVAYVGDGKNKKELGVELHSGKNRIVRRMFEHLGYKVVKLDRVSFAGLTKKNLVRGKFRHLTEREIGSLKMVR